MFKLISIKMKSKIVFYVTILVLAIGTASCKKEYYCQTEDGLTLTAVEARSEKKAKTLCPRGSNPIIIN